MGRRLLPLVLVLALLPATAAAVDEDDPFADDFGDDQYRKKADSPKSAPAPVAAPATEAAPSEPVKPVESAPNPDPAVRVEPEQVVPEQSAPEQVAPEPGEVEQTELDRAEPARVAPARVEPARVEPEEDRNRYERSERRWASEDEDRAAPRASRYAEEPRPEESADFGAPTGSVSLDIGGGLVSLGGLAYPKIAFSGSPDNGFRAFGLGAAFRLNYDFPAMDFDWRVGVNGAMPGYLGVRGTVGISKDLSPVSVPRFVARGGVGIELMLAHANYGVVGDTGFADATFLVPNFVADGEVSLEFEPAPRFTLGFVIGLGIRYGLPLGFGFDVIGYLPRLKYAF